MSQEGRTTFIPQGASIAPRPAQKTVGVFTIISIIVFIASVLGLGVAISYDRSLETQIIELDKLIGDYEDAFDRPLLEEIARVDKKIKSAREILAKHRSLATMFDFINKNTLHAIRFTAFGFEDGGEDGFVLTLQGVGRDYSSIALQSDAFVQTRRLKNVVFSNLRLNNDGTISFLLTAEIEAPLLAYSINP